jgi:hypothetical protein
VDRFAAKGPRRRPVRVEFCDADVLDVFDEWRRAVGVAAVSPDAATRAAPHGVTRRSPPISIGWWPD